MLAIALSFYNDLESLKRGVPTWVESVDKVYAIDGKYAGNPSLNDYSTDGSVEYLAQFPNVELDRFVGYEYEKRNRYLKPECDHLLIIDSDEYVVQADWELFKYNLEVQTKANQNQSFFGVNFIVDGAGGLCAYPRLWYKPSQIEYYKAHCIFHDKRTGVLTRSSSTTATKYLIDGIILTGDDKLRSKEYISNTFEYQKKMIDMERPIRRSLA